MSRLDIYRKQAKQLVRWHREGNYSIGGRIRGLARYQSLTDREALAREFSPENIAATGGSSTASRSHWRYRFVQLCLRLPRQTKGAFLDTGFRTRTRLGSLVASAVAVVPAPGVLMVRLEPESVLLKANVRKRLRGSEIVPANWDLQGNSGGVH